MRKASQHIENFQHLLLLAKSFALDRNADEIGDEDLNQALRAFDVSGDPAGVRNVLAGRTSGDAPLSPEEFRRRLDRADKLPAIRFREETKQRLWFMLSFVKSERVRLTPAVPSSADETAAADETAPADEAAAADETASAAAPEAGPVVASGPSSVLEARIRWEKQLKAAVKGQDEAMNELTRRLVRANRPSGTPGPAGLYVLAGAPSSGKSLAARTMARLLGVAHYSFDCSLVGPQDEHLIRGSDPSYKAAKPGYVTDWVRRHPRCVVELRHFEMMCPQVRSFLREILDEGRLKDLCGFYKDGENPENGKPVAPPEVDFHGAHLVLEVHGCAELYDNPELLRRYRADRSLRRALVNALGALEVRQAYAHAPSSAVRIFDQELLTRLENRACFCLFTPLDSATLTDIARAALPAGLGETAGRLGLDKDAVEPMSEADLDAAARILLWEKGGRPAAASLSAGHFADAFEDPCYEFLRDLAGDAPARLRLTLDRDAHRDLADIARDLGEEPVRALFRSLRRLRWEAVVSREGDALTLTMTKPALVLVPAVEDFGDGGKLVVTAPETRFADVAGLEEEKARLRLRVREITDWKRLGEEGFNTQGGVLLHGPPGTGKTLLASACAGEFGLPYAAVKGVDLADVDHLEQLFARMKQYAPSILFVDEIDAICDPRFRPALLALQTHMDGFASGGTAPVFIIATTNRRPEELAEPLVRPGRLGMHIEVPLPGREARRQMFKRVERRLEKGVLDLLLDLSAGMNGAGLNEAVRSLFRHEGALDARTARDILLGGLYGERLTVSAEIRRKVAHHEAGHAALQLLGEAEGEVEDAQLRYITLTFRERDTAHASTESLRKVVVLKDRRRLLYRMAILLGGMVAESILAGDGGRVRDPDFGDASDLTRAADLALYMLRLEREGFALPPPDREEASPLAAAAPPEWMSLRMRALRDEAEALAQRKLLDNWPLVTALAEALLDREALCRAEIDVIVNTVKKSREPAENRAKQEKAELMRQMDAFVDAVLRGAASGRGARGQETDTSHKQAKYFFEEIP